MAGTCAAGESFRVSGFQLDGYDGCYEASSVSTFNFLPVFYLGGGVPADGPTVYASDLFGALSDEYVWAIGNYDQRRDVVDARHCYDDDGNDASAVAPPDVTSWNCGDLSSTFTVTCGCNTPSPAAPETPGPSRSPSVAPAQAGTTSPLSAPAASPTPTGVPSVGTNPPSASLSSTPAPSSSAESREVVDGVPSPAPTATAADANATPPSPLSPPSPPPSTSTPAPSSSAGSRDVVGRSPSPAPTTTAAGQNAASPSTPSPSSSSSSSSSGALQATTCSADDPFRLDGYDSGSYDGCYLASEVSTFNFLPVFFLGDGVPADGPAVYASDLFGSLANETYVWAIGNYNLSQDVVNSRECFDADKADASTLHPSAVTNWTCQGTSRETASSAETSAASASFTVACGCATPAPTVFIPVSGSDGRGGVDVPSSAPVGLAAETIVSSEEETPLAVVISAVLAGIIVVAICLAIAFEGLRKGLWMCFTCKRESTSQDGALSAPNSSASRLSLRRGEPRVAGAAAAAAAPGAVETGHGASPPASSGVGGDSTASHAESRRSKQ